MNYDCKLQYDILLSKVQPQDLQAFDKDLGRIEVKEYKYIILNRKLNSSVFDSISQVHSKSK